MSFKQETLEELRKERDLWFKHSAFRGERLRLAIERLQGNEKLLEMLVECSGEVIHANDVLPELKKTREILNELVINKALR